VEKEQKVQKKGQKSLVICSCFPFTLFKEAVIGNPKKKTGHSIY
jgi:hypothetical protein